MSRIAPPIEHPWDEWGEFGKRTSPAHINTGKRTYSLEVVEPMRIRGKKPFHLDDRSATPKNFSDSDDRLAKIQAKQEAEANRVREPYWAWTMIDADRD